MFDTFLFAAIPYLAVALAVIGGIWRYRKDRFSYSSQSSQFLESRTLFWGSVAWHYGILAVLAAHVGALMFWDGWATMVSAPARLYSLEIAGLALAFLAFVGLGILIFRRLRSPRLLTVTTSMDWLLLVVLFAQVGLGIWVALGYRWGSCSPHGSLNFHWRVILLPPRIVEYLVAHELTHLAEPHHNPEFWSRLERAMPDFAARKGVTNLSGEEIELMNLSGPATGLEMMQPVGLTAPTPNFFARRAYYVNKMVIGKTSAELLAEFTRRMDLSSRKPGAIEFAQAFDEARQEKLPWR